LWRGWFATHEKFRRLTLRSATGFSQREKHHLGAPILAQPRQTENVTLVQ
jgi:hypothetical protein